MINWQAFGGIAQAVAAVTTLLLVIATFVIIRRDQARLKVNLTIVQESSGGILKIDSLEVDITNVGRRPLTVVAWGIKKRAWFFQYKYGYMHFCSKHRMLSENGKPELAYSRELLNPILTAKIFFVRDSTGKEWRMRRYKLKRLKTRLSSKKERE